MTQMSVSDIPPAPPASSPSPDLPPPGTNVPQLLSLADMKANASAAPAVSTTTSLPASNFNIARESVATNHETITARPDSLSFVTKQKVGIHPPPFPPPNPV